MLQEAGDDPLKKANLINEIADTVAEIPDAIKRQVYVETVARRFEIETDIIQERVRKTREKLRKEMPGRSRQQMPGQAGHDGTQAGHDGGAQDGQDPTSLPATTGNLSRQFQKRERILEPSERELLRFILQYGRTPLQFESDSDFYDEEGTQTVAEFIDAALGTDDIHFANTAYEATYQAYFQDYDQGLEQDAIVRNLLNGENREIAGVAADLATEKYELTVHNFSEALTTTDSWLVNYVPKAILVYHDKRISAQQQELKQKLGSPDLSQADMVSLLNQLNKLNEIKKTINIKLGRIKK